MTPLSHGGKRAVDIVVACLALAALLPALPLIALAVVVESRGPVIVLRPAVGVQRRRPRARGGAEDARRMHDVGGVLLRLPEFRLNTVPRPGAPSRLTHVGRWLARTHLAHWPRFVSVLLGDLALVGPRPLSPRCVAELLARAPAWEDQLLGVKPGLLGPAQAHGRAGTGWVSALRDRVLFELDYGARLARAQRVRDVLALDLRVVRACCARALRSRVPLGHEVVRIDAPARILHAPVDARMLLVPAAPWADADEARLHARNGQAAADPDAALADGPRGPASELHPHGDRLTAFWYPPRRRGLAVPVAPAGAEDLLRTADEPFEARWLVAEERPDCQLLLVHALRADAAPAGPADELHLDLPGGLHELARVCEQLLPLWEALGRQHGEAALASRVTRLLLAGFARVAAGRSNGRIALDVHVSSDRLVLQFTALAPPPTPAAPPELALPRMALAPSLGTLPLGPALPAGTAPMSPGSAPPSPAPAPAPAPAPSLQPSRPRFRAG